MDIEGEFSKRKILKTSTGSFDLTLCKWKALSSTIPKKREISNPPCQGYIHSSAILKGSLYTVIGPDQKHPEQSMYSYNFKASQWRYWPDCNLPTNRDSFGFTSHQTELYIFGGSNLDSQFGDTYVFSNFTSTWRPLSGFEPSPRNPMIFSDVNGQYIILYGGVDIQAEKILDDAYILVDGAWKQLQTRNSPSGLIGASSAVCQDELYIFGGQLQQQGGNFIPNTKIYKLMMDVENLEVNFIQIPLANDLAPCSRVSHSMVGIESGNIVMTGGVGLTGENKSQILKDLWIFNTDELKWTRVDPVNGSLRGFSESWLCLHNNKIYILGGLVQRLDTWNEQVTILQFGEDETIRNQICSNCQQRTQIRQKQEKAFPKTIVVSTGFFYNVSMEYKHPFQAVVALYQCAAFLGANSFHFSISKGISENQFIEIEWSGRSLSRDEFEQLICHSSSSNEPFTKVVNILKIASFRLGKTLLYINANQKQRQVFLLSADSKVCPQFDQTYSFFAYLQNAERDMIESHEGRNNRKIIVNMLRSRISNPEFLLARKSGTLLLIFEKNILVTSEKTYYYELISSAMEDITVYRSNKKVQFLDQLGYNITKEPELSLKSYLSICSINPLLTPFYINRNQVPIQSLDYLQKLKMLEEQGKISQIDMIKGVDDLDYDAWLYQADGADVIEGNLGILIYFQGNLVNRFDVNFGDLFKQAFYKTKFKVATTVFANLGVINVKGGLCLNYLSTCFKRKKNYYTLIENIREAIRKAKLDQFQRRLRIVSEEGEQRKQSKQHKS